MPATCNSLFVQFLFHFSFICAFFASRVDLSNKRRGGLNTIDILTGTATAAAAVDVKQRKNVDGDGTKKKWANNECTLRCTYFRETWNSIFFPFFYFIFILMKFMINMKNIIYIKNTCAIDSAVSAFVCFSNCVGIFLLSERNWLSTRLQRERVKIGQKLNFV